jgi:hypothetical protein
MQVLWCWRCKMDVPMLDEAEFGRVVGNQDLPREGADVEARLATMLADYVRITGFHETNPVAVYHHRLSLYGPACGHCSKPLRTPRSRTCGNCMRPVNET